MNTELQSAAWISYLLIALGSTVAVSVVGAITLLLLSRPIPDILFALGTVAGAGLLKLLISPLNQSLFE